MRVAIAGGGLMGKWHAYYARRCGAEVCAVVDPVLPEEEVRRRFPGAAPFATLERALDTSKPQVLHVCAPSASHEELIERALGAGVHVLAEKPLAATAAATARLLREAAKRAVLLNPVHQYVFQDGFLKIQKSLERIGTPLHFDGVVRSAGGVHLDEKELDGLAADILPHPLSALDVSFPGILADTEWSVMRPRAGEWRAAGEAPGLAISLLVSLHGRPTESSMRLTGTSGTAHVDFFHGFGIVECGDVSRWQKIRSPFELAALTFWTAAGNLALRTIRREPAYPGLRRLIREFYRAVNSHGEAPLSDEHAIAVAAGRDRLVAAACALRPIRKT